MSKDKLSYLQAFLADLKSERDELNILIEATEERIRRLGGEVDAPPTQAKTAKRQRTTKPQDSTPTLPYAGLTIYDAAQKYLEKVKEPQSGRQIYEAITQGGLPNIHYNAVYTALWRRRAPEGIFVKEGEGQNARWSLKDAKQTQAAKPSNEALQPTPRSRDGLSLTDYCVMILREANKPLHAQVLVSELAKKGSHTTVDSMSSTFRRDSKKRFENMGRNTWALSEWPESVKNQGRKESTLPYEQKV